MEWTLRTELLNLASLGPGADAIHALRDLGLISADEAPIDVHINDAGSTWLRLGAETYCFRFEVQIGTETPQAYMLKACTTFTGRPLEEIVSEWIRRRRTLESSGVSTPRLYASGNATILEEYIPYSLMEALSKQARGERPHLIQSIGKAIEKICQLQFAPLTIHDWRSRGQDVVLIDFGTDLGSAGAAASGMSGHAMAALICAQAESLGDRSLSQAEIADIEAARRDEASRAQAPH